MPSRFEKEEEEEEEDIYIPIQVLLEEGETLWVVLLQSTALFEELNSSSKHRAF
jgi:hypothetical protein